MDKYECTVCGYVYNPEIGDPNKESQQEQASSNYQKNGGAPFAEPQKPIHQKTMTTHSKQPLMLLIWCCFSRKVIIVC